eukprot:7433316-Heterocapsa_arctica.AAC.1
MQLRRRLRVQARRHDVCRPLREPRHWAVQVRRNMFFRHTELDKPRKERRDRQVAALAGLGDWLRGLLLHKYEEKAEEWCEELGVGLLEEVFLGWADIADALDSKPLERRRLIHDRKEAAAGVAAKAADAARK